MKYAESCHGLKYVCPNYIMPNLYIIVYILAVAWKNQCGFGTGRTQTKLYKHRRWLEAGNFGFREELYYPCGENKGVDKLNSADCWFSHAMAHIIFTNL